MRKEPKRNVRVKQQEKVVEVRKEEDKEEETNKFKIPMQITPRGWSQIKRVAGLSGVRYFSLSSNRLAVSG
jgi:hypothetical protein